jgi:short chain dehydrogenase
MSGSLNYLESEEPDAREVVDLIEQAGRKAFALPGDISDESFCKSLIADSTKKLGGLDILINVAGRQHSADEIADLSTEQFEATFRTNVSAMFWLCKFALAYMPAGATIINTTSIQSYQPSPHLLDYASTKGAITAFTHALPGDGRSCLRSRSAASRQRIIKICRSAQPRQLSFDFRERLLMLTDAVELPVFAARSKFSGVFINIESRRAASDMPTPSVIASFPASSRNSYV